MPPYTLKQMAEDGYVLGLSTIGEVANHMRSHHYAYFLSDYLDEEMIEFDDMVASHEASSIDLWLTPEDKKRLDDELDKAMAQPHKGHEETNDEKDEEEGEGEGQAQHADHADDDARRKE